MLYRLRSRFKHLPFALALLVALCAMNLSAPQAHAQTHRALVSGTGYDGLNPISTGCANDAIDLLTAPFANGFGSVHLRWSASCQTIWAKLTFTNPLPANTWGQAFIASQTLNNASYDCNQGGNGYVQPGQTSCYTGMVYDGGTNQGYAVGDYSPPSGPVVQIGTNSI